MSDEAIDEQRRIDEERKAEAWRILDTVKIDTVDRAKDVAHGWIVCALQAMANESFVHEQRVQTQRQLEETTRVLARVATDNAQLTTHLTDVQERGSTLMIELQNARNKLRLLYEAWPHWQCPAPCFCFNGEAKGRQEVCRACGGPRPKDVP